MMLKKIFASLFLSLTLVVPVAAFAIDTQSQNAVQAGICQTNPSAPNCGGSSTAGFFSPGGIFSTVAHLLIYIVGALSVLFVIIGGMRYVLSNGNPGAVSGAKDTILYALIGVAVSILSYAAVNFVVSKVGG